MLVRVLLASQHGFAAAEPVLAELDDARRALAAQRIDLAVTLLGRDTPAGEGFADSLRSGFALALADGADAIVSLDADGQHDPRQIPDLVRSHLHRGSGLTIGSRWTRGGSSPGTGPTRTLLSRTGNALVKAFTGARGVSDSTTSFRVYRPDVAEVLLHEDLPAETYGFFSAMVAVVQAHGFAVDEVPIVFRPRHLGPAPLSSSDLREFARNLPTIRRQVHRTRRRMRSNQSLWAQRSPRLRAQEADGGSTFGATEELANLADADRFLTWISASLLPHLGRDVLEVGAGVGAIATKIAAAGHRVLAIEPAANVFPELERRTSGVEDLRVRQITSGELLAEGAGSSFDSVVYVSVLEHIRDDIDELRTAAALLRPGGTVALFVPAMPSLYGSLDFKSGHFRRYDRELLQQVITGAGLEVVECRYMDLLGVVPYFLMYRLLDVASLGSGSSAVYDRLIVPLSRRFERLVGPPAVGKNLVAVARRPRGSNPSGAAR